MPVVNIVDRRKRQYRFLVINAVVEAAWHDNRCEDSDQVKHGRDDGPDYAEREHVSLAEALRWANEFKTAVTLYIYDRDGGIYPATEPLRTRGAVAAREKKRAVVRRKMVPA